MKGVIPVCLKKMIIENHGNNHWPAILEDAGLPNNTMFSVREDVEDTIILKVMASCAKVLEVSMSDIIDEFGDYWVNTFAPKIYYAYYLGVGSAKEMILKIDRIHNMVTRDIENAKPPRFQYEEVDAKTLRVTYNSERNLIDLFIGLTKGIGRYFKEDLKIIKIDEKHVEIKFE